MVRGSLAVVVLAVCCAALPASASATAFTPGALGIGDPYFPLDGNGGYDARHYRLDVHYAPRTGKLTGVATIRAVAAQNLSAFNLDLRGLHVRSVTVDGRAATWSRHGHELTVEPPAGLAQGTRFTAVIAYDGVPKQVSRGPGFIHTDDGALVIGEPHVAATWYPVNDHALDKAAYTFHVTVPAGLEAIANGVLERHRTRQGSTTWVWDAREPMASYLTTATIGEFQIHSYRKRGIRYWDALDPDLLTRTAPRTGAQFAISQAANDSFKRLTRTLDVPASGGSLSFWVDRDTQPFFDYMFVEAHRPGSDDWTTLPDENGHTSQDTGIICPFSLDEHPFLKHYQSPSDEGGCTPTGTTGEWNAASGASDGYEQWQVDLGDFAGGPVELSISYASDFSGNYGGVFVDDVAVSSGPGSTSFEDDGDALDGWTVPGAPAGETPNANDWIVGAAADGPPSVGEVAEGALAQQPKVIAFLSGLFGPYPFTAAGGIVDDQQGVGLALENQTRPIYDVAFFHERIDSPAFIVVHELAHQWVGDDVSLGGWQHIWLNEGFATYAEWLWDEAHGGPSAQDRYDATLSLPEDDPLWSVPIGDPGRRALLDNAVYTRGAAALHALRLEVGDSAFFRILREWTSSNAGGNVTIPEFIALAERVSGRQLDGFFTAWLFTPEKPPGRTSTAAG